MWKKGLLSKTLNNPLIISPVPIFCAGLKSPTPRIDHSTSKASCPLQACFLRVKIALGPVKRHYSKVYEVDLAIAVRITGNLGRANIEVAIACAPNPYQVSVFTRGAQ